MLRECEIVSGVSEPESPTQPALPPAPSPAVTPSAGRGRMITAHVLAVLAAICAVIGLLAGYIRYQAFDDSTFNKTAAQLIADPAIRQQVSATLVDQLYANVDVQAQLKKQLPAAQKGLAGPIAAAFRQLAYRGADELLSRPRVQGIWVAAASTAHDNLLKLLDDRGTYVRTSNGAVVLNLQPLVVKLGDQIAIVGKLGQQLPPNSAQVTILKSDQLRSAQTITHVLKTVGSFMWLVALLLAVGAVWLATGRRRRMVREVAAGFAIASLLVLMLRRLGGHYITNHLVTTESVRPAAAHAWSILTSLLADGAWTLFFASLLALAWAWLAGEHRSAVSSRRWLAKWLARPEYAFGAVAVFVLVIVWWGPTPQTRRWYLVIAVTAILALGVEALRRQTARETAPPA